MAVAPTVCLVSTIEVRLAHPALKRRQAQQQRRKDAAVHSIAEASFSEIVQRIRFTPA